MSSHPSPTFGDAAQVNAAAVAVFESQVTLPTFVRREWRPDTFVDYKIELVDAGEPGGRFAYVQLKGQRAVVRQGDDLAFVMETKHLAYYCRKLREPVFLVLVDVAAKAGYFVFIQEWADRNHAEEKFGQQDTMTVKVPVANELAVAPLFRDRIEQAIAYMRQKHPGSVEDAINAETNFWAKLDPRYKPSITATNAKRQIKFEAQEPVPFQVKPTQANSAAAARLQALIGYGQGAEFTPAEIAMEGSPLYATLLSHPQVSSIRLRPAEPQACELILTAAGTDFLLVIPGHGTAGNSGFGFESNLPDIPFACNLMVDHAVIKGGGGARFNYRWDFRGWAGKSVGVLPQFTPIRALARKMTEQATLEARLRINGEDTGMAALGPLTVASGQEGGPLLIELLSKARRVAAGFKLSLKVPADLTFMPEDLVGIETGFELLTSGAAPLTNNQVTVELTLVPQLPVANRPAFVPVSKEAAAVSLPFPSLPMNIFGTPCEFGPVTLEMDQAAMTFDEASIKAFQEGRCDSIRAIQTPLPNTAVRYVRNPAAG